MNGEYLRGEVWWVCLDDSVGGEERTGRPAVIISNNSLNTKMSTVTVAFVSMSGFASATRPSIESPDGKKRRVLCDQLRTIDKSRLDRYDSTLTESELIRVTGALASALCLPPPRYDKKPFVEETPVVADKPDETTSLRCEADMWRRMYERTMDQLVEIRMAADMSKKSESPKKTPVKSALREPDLGYEEDVEESEPKKKKKSPKKNPTPEKEEVSTNDAILNINTATAKELMEKLGMSQVLAYSITGYRNKNGRFVELKELMEVKRVTESTFDRYKDRLTIGEQDAEV